MVGSRLLALALAAAAVAAGAVGLPGLAFWLGLLVVPPASAAAFVAASDVLEGRRLSRLRAVTTGCALTLLVVASAARTNAATGGGVPRLVTWSLVLALGCYGLPAIAWLVEPVRAPARSRPERRRRRRRSAEAETDALSRAA